jgi:hypothetical protein
LSAASVRADRLLAMMTFEEKVALAVHDFEAVALRRPAAPGRRHG